MALGLIYVDADACPVKAEIYKVAERHALHVQVVANSFIQTPRVTWVALTQVGDGPDAADDWIAERAGPADIVITADIPLAARCVKAGATVLAPTGRPFDERTIGMALATRNLMTELRSAGESTRGPKAFTPRDRSAFLSALHEAIVQLKRRLPP